MVGAGVGGLTLQLEARLAEASHGSLWGLHVALPKTMTNES